MWFFHSAQLTIATWNKNSHFYQVMVNTKIEAMMTLKYKDFTFIFDASPQIFLLVNC